MKVTLDRQINYFEVDSNFTQSLKSFFQMLQEAAVHHSETVNVDSADLVQAGTVWVLNRMAVDIRRLPEYRESIQVITWSKGMRGFRAYRDFAVFAGNEQLAAATSLWLYFDLNRRRLIRIPPEYRETYTAETDSALAADLDSFRPETDFSPDVETRISLRQSDIDPLGHVNNAVYLDYIDTLLACSRKTAAHRLKNLKMLFQNEINREVETVTAGLSGSGTDWRFKIFSADTIHAAGELRLGELLP